MRNKTKLDVKESTTTLWMVSLLTDTWRNSFP